MVDWDPTEVLTCLESVPDVDAEETNYHYLVRRGDFTVELTVWPYASAISCFLRHASTRQPLLEFSMENCCAIRYIKDTKGERLVFRSDPDRRASIPFGFCLRVDPQVQVRLLGWMESD